MLNQFFHKVKEFLESAKIALDKNKIIFEYIIIAVVILFVLFISFDINFVSFNNIKVNHRDPENIALLFLSEGFFYIIFTLTSLKIDFMLFFFYLPTFILLDLNIESIYRYITNIHFFMKNDKFDSVRAFNDYYSSLNYMNYYNFEYTYLRTKRFKKLILINSNLPILFYFFILFLITTIFSLIFLSYLGLYGSFFINLIPHYKKKNKKN